MAMGGKGKERIVNPQTAAASSAPVPAPVGSGSNPRGTEPPVGQPPPLAPQDSDTGAIQPPTAPLAPQDSNAGAIQPPTGPAFAAPLAPRDSNSSAIRSLPNPAANPPRKFVFEYVCLLTSIS